MFKDAFKGTGAVAQVVECLPSKHEALSTIPSTEERKMLLRAWVVVRW
jgi:hypothetical protein